MPYRIGKTTKTEESERAELEAAVRDMGSAGYAIVDPMDEISFLENSMSGTGYLSYESLEERCQKVISKLVLGHADAMDSTPGKLGAGQDGEESPVASALKDKQTKDGKMIERLVNRQLIPKMQNIGFKIPAGFRFEYKNDAEKMELRDKEDKSNLNTATIAQTMKNAGFQMSPEYFKERTGIETEVIETPEPTAPGEEDKQQLNKVQNRLREIYS
jgi:hypothetical protein